MEEFVMNVLAFVNVYLCKSGDKMLSYSGLDISKLPEEDQREYSYYHGQNQLCQEMIGFILEQCFKEKIRNVPLQSIREFCEQKLREAEEAKKIILREKETEITGHLIEWEICNTEAINIYGGLLKRLNNTLF